MKAKLVDSRPVGGAWLYEIKFDGCRALALRGGRDTLRIRDATGGDDRTLYRLNDLWNQGERDVPPSRPPVVWALAV